VTGAAYRERIDRRKRRNPSPPMTKSRSAEVYSRVTSPTVGPSNGCPVWFVFILKREEETRGDK
jgi:hypothetical protein